MAKHHKNPKHHHEDHMHAHHKPHHQMAHGSKGARQHGSQSIHEDHGDSSVNLYTGAQTSSKHGNPKHIARDQYEMAPHSKCLSSERRLLKHTGSVYRGGSEKD